MNLQHFEIVIAAMEQEPLRVNMGEWISTPWDMPYLCDTSVHAGIPKCGIIGGIAGWAAILTLDGKFEDPMPEYFDAADIAVKKLGISPIQETALFYSSMWPRKFQNEIAIHHPGTKPYIDVVIARMRYMMETGE